jgi:hypothetical protein
MNKNTVILITLLLTLQASTYAYGAGYNFCKDVTMGARSGQPNHNYIFAKRLWNRLNIHDSEDNKATVSFNKNASKSSFFNTCMAYSGESRTTIILNLFNTYESMRQTLDDIQ